MLRESKELISFDETIIRSTTRRNYSWALKGACSIRYFAKESKDLSLLLAITSDGGVFFQFLTGNNNDVSVRALFLKLVEHLD